MSFLFVTYTIIQSIMGSEMCSLHLTHPSGAVGSLHCSARGAVGGLVPCSRVSPQSCRSRDSNPQPWVTSDFKSNALSIRPRLPNNIRCSLIYVATRCETESFNCTSNINSFKSSNIFTSEAVHQRLKYTEISCTVLSVNEYTPFEK